MKTIKSIWALAFGALFLSCQGDQFKSDATGVFESTEVIVSAQETGRLLEWKVEEGRAIERDSYLGRIDSAQLVWKRQSLLAGLSANDSKLLDEKRQIASLEQQISNLEKEKARFVSLLQAKAGTEKQVDDLDYQIAVLRRQLAATKETVESGNKSVSAQSRNIQAQISQLEDCIAKCIVRSPASGTVMEKYVEEGEWVTPGKPLCKVSDLKTMKLRAYVTAEQVNGLKIGDKVKVYADEGEESRREYAGTVVWIASEAEFTPKTIQTREERANLVYAVKIEVKNDGKVKRGMYGEVVF
ncbi:MAG: HlyD family secretion protein [Alloprevotella sp.]